MAADTSSGAACRGDVADFDAADFSASGEASDQFRLFRLTQGGACVFEKLGAGVGQGDRAFGAIEQPHSELALDVLYLLCQRGWADVEPFCRTRAKCNSSASVTK